MLGVRWGEYTMIPGETTLLSLTQKKVIQRLYIIQAIVYDTFSYQYLGNKYSSDMADMVGHGNIDIL